jgi:hypothetical protein
MLKWNKASRDSSSENVDNPLALDSASSLGRVVSLRRGTGEEERMPLKSELN